MGVVLLQLIGHVNYQDGATPTFSADYKSSVLVLSNDVSFVSELFWEGGKKAKIFYRKLACAV